MPINSVDKQDLQRFKVLLLTMVCALVTSLIILSNGFDQYSALGFIFALFIATYLADFISGLLHFIVDYTPCKKGVGLDKLFYYKGKKSSPEYLQLRSRVMKKAGILQHPVFFFKHHHLTSPKQVATRPAYTTFLPTLPATIFFFFLSALISLNNAPAYISLTLFLTGAVIFWAQYIHSIAHGRHPNSKFINILHRYKIIMSPKYHAIHHQDPERHFCFINGWADPLVNRLVKIALARGLFSKDALLPPLKEQ